MKQKLLLLVVALCMSIGNSWASTYYGKLILISNIDGAGGVHATDGTDIDIPETINDYTKNALEQSAFTAIWNDSKEFEYTVYAYAKPGYIFMGWAEDKDGINIICPYHLYQGSYTSTSTSKRNPTTKTLYAIFRAFSQNVTTSDAPEDGSEYYILNYGQQRFLKADASSVAMTDDMSQATVFTFSGSSSTKLAYKVGETTYYLGQYEGTLSISTESTNREWTIQDGIDGGKYFYNNNEDDSWTNIYRNRIRYIQVNMHEEDGVKFMYHNFVSYNRTWFLVKKDKVTTANLAVSGTAKYGTFIAPFDVTLPAGITAYTIGSYEQNDQSTYTLNLTKVADPNGTLTANTAVILSNATDATVTKTYQGLSTGEENENSGNYLIGTYELSTAPAGSYLLQYKDEEAMFLQVPDGGLNCGKNRAYLKSFDAEIKAFRFSGTETGIDEIVVVDDDNENASIYDLSGRRLSKKPASGIYIQNGKKILVK